MKRWQYTKGLHEIGSGHFAYLQPDGGWGYSNAGLIVDGEQSLLVDTLFDEKLTSEMLKAMKDAVRIGGADITTLVNTHANGDHTFGNHLVTNAEIIASKASAEELVEQPPAMLAEYMRLAPQLGDMGEYLIHCFGDFDFDGIVLRPPTKTFSGQLDLSVGDKKVHLVEVGPAHTHGDTLVYAPKDKVVYTGDILFIDGTPIMWAGPVKNWVQACDRILGWDVDVVVPGHGPVTDKAGVAKVREYLVYVDREARKRFDAGLSAEEAALDIAITDYSAWESAERIAVNVDSLYREYSGSTESPDISRLFGLMGRLYKERRRGSAKSTPLS